MYVPLSLYKHLFILKPYGHTEVLSKFVLIPIYDLHRNQNSSGSKTSGGGGCAQTRDPPKTIGRSMQSILKPYSGNVRYYCLISSYSGADFLMVSWLIELNLSSLDSP